MSKEISESEKTILTGRIYPAIQSCVSNRYKIIVGYFAIVGFLLVNEEKLKRFIDSGAVVFLAIIFTILVVHNSTNYWLNAKEQCKLEKINRKIPVVDVLSSIVMTILIWGGYLFLKKFSCTA